MELAHHQPRVLDPLLQLPHHRHAFLQLRIFGLSPFQISFAIWLGKTPGESLLILTVTTCRMVCQSQKRQ